MNDDDDVICGDVPVSEKFGKGHTVDSRYSPSSEDIKASTRAARKARNTPMPATKADNAGGPTNVKGI